MKKRSFIELFRLLCCQQRCHSFHFDGFFFFLFSFFLHFSFTFSFSISPPFFSMDWFIFENDFTINLKLTQIGKGESRNLIMDEIDQRKKAGIIGKSFPLPLFSSLFLSFPLFPFLSKNLNQKLFRSDQKIPKSRRNQKNYIQE